MSEGCEDIKEDLLFVQRFCIVSRTKMFAFAGCIFLLVKYVDPVFFSAILTVRLKKAQCFTFKRKLLTIFVEHMFMLFLV